MCSKKRESKKDKNVKVNRVMSLSIGLGFLVLLSTAAVSQAAVPLDDPPLPPSGHFIIGFASYHNGPYAYGATVSVQNNRTSDTIITTVGNTGYYEVNLDNMSQGIQNDDALKIRITGTGQYSGWSGLKFISLNLDRIYTPVNMVLTSGVNNPPDSPSNMIPLDGATGINLNPTLQVTVSDPDNDPLRVTFYEAETDSIIGTVDTVESGKQASVTWSGRAPASTYQWYVVVSDSQLEAESNIWSFTTQSMANHAPGKPTLVSPQDKSTGVSRSPSLQVTVSDPDADLLTVTFYNADTNGIIGTVTDVESGSPAQVTWTGRSYSTTYKWYVISTDSQLSTPSDIWQFVTQAQPVIPTDKEPSAPQNLTATPGDKATDIYTILTWKVPSDTGSTVLTNYKIYRGTEPGQLVLHETVGSVLLAYTDTGLEANQTYYYRISAVNSIGEGVRSTEVSATTRDTTAPTITDATLSPQSFTADDTITITAQVTDLSSIAEVVAIIGIDGEEIQRVTLTSQGENLYGGEWTAGDRDKYDVAVTASDIWNNQQQVEIGELKHKDEGIPGFELMALLVSFLVMLGALTVTRHLKKT